MSQLPIRCTPANRKDDFVYQITSPSKRKNWGDVEGTTCKKEFEDIPRTGEKEEGNEDSYFQNMRYDRDEDDLTVNQNGKKKSWTVAEDNLLVQLIQKYGAQKWTFISQHLQGRIGKQCRQRWHNHLNPNIKKDQWSDKQEWLLYLSHRLLGNRWADISKYIVGRTDNSIKNHWNSSMKKKNQDYHQKYKSLRRNPLNINKLSPIEKQLLDALSKIETNIYQSTNAQNTKDRRRGFQPTQTYSHTKQPINQSVITQKNTTKAPNQQTQDNEHIHMSIIKKQDQKMDFLHVPQTKKKKVRIIDTEKTYKKVAQRFDFAATPKKDDSQLHSFIFSPHPSECFHMNSVQKPAESKEFGNSELCVFNSPSILLNLNTPRKTQGGFSGIVLFPVEHDENENY